VVDPDRRAKLPREVEQGFVPDSHVLNMPSGDKRAPCTRSSLSLRVGRIEQSLAETAAIIEPAISKA
jgi:hypothetical protein